MTCVHVALERNAKTAVVKMIRLLKTVVYKNYKSYRKW